jgi:multiple sugar transport system ATP-binding protein
MSQGLLQQLDTPLNLYNHPVNMFVAGFIGTPSMNFLAAKISEDDKGKLIDGGCFKLRVPAEKADLLKGYVGKDITFGIRPEDIFDKNLPNIIQPTDENQATATVDVMELMGATVTMTLKCGGHSLIATIDADTKAKEDQPLEMIFDANKYHVFDKDTQVAIF